MAVTINAKGTSENTFVVGKQGPKIKNNAGDFEFRNTADTASAKIINFKSTGLDDNATETVITIDVDETVQMYRNQADANELLTLIQDNTTASGDVVAIGNDGTGDSIQIVNTGNAKGIYIDSSASSANAIEVLNQFVVSSISSPVNYLSVSAAITDNSPSISAVGSNANIDVEINPKGDGSVKLSTGTGDATLSSDAAATSSGLAGSALTITTGAGDGVGKGGDLNIQSGAGGASGDGGDINLLPGSKGASGTNNGAVNISGKVNLPQYTVANLPSDGAAGDAVYCTNGDTGSPCLAVHNGTNWKVVALGATVSAT